MEYFYGFIGGETNQYYPAIYEGTTPLEPPKTPEQGYVPEGWHPHEGGLLKYRVAIRFGEEPDTMPDGWKAWIQWQRAVAPDNAIEIAAVEADAGRTLGYVRVVARRLGARQTGLLPPRARALRRLGPVAAAHDVLAVRLRASSRP